MTETEQTPFWASQSDNPLDVQDAYTLRCMPQVHGAARDAILYARWVLSIELNSATDNPLIFFDDETGEATVLCGGSVGGRACRVGKVQTGSKYGRMLALNR